ncbi:MAG: hypothetical protein GY859_06920 [Desulfobacterales bacterium]|nr:hypothetical protein [Desulfobacterales bacterium]
MNESESTSAASIHPISIRPELKIHTLGHGDIEKIHRASLTVLQEAGARFPSRRALAVFEEAGADVDHESQIVKIPPDLLMESVGRAPRTYTMASRGDESLDLRLDGSNTYCGTDGTGTTTVDLTTGEPRPSTKADVAMMARISDYLSCVSFYWPMVSALDVPDPVIPLHEIEASVANTEKHVHIISCTKPEQAKYAVEMARVISGAGERMRKRPPLSILACPISPLNHDGEALDAALVFAEAGLPAGFATMPMLGSSAPASVPGLLVTGNAELLSAICYIQLVHPGAPVFYALFSTVLNPHTGGCVSSTVHQHHLQCAVIDLGRFYDLPVMSSYGSGDSRRLDSWLTGKEACIDTMFSYMHQPDMFPSMGLLDNDTLLHPEQIILENEVYDSIKAMSRGLDVTEESLAVDEILKVGPGGHFLDAAHTSKNIRKMWAPGVTRQWAPEKGDFLEPREAALEKVHWILENHHPRPLDEKAAAEIKKIISAAEKELLQG